MEGSSWFGAFILVFVDGQAVGHRQGTSEELADTSQLDRQPDPAPR